MKFPFKWNGYIIRSPKISDAKLAMNFINAFVEENADINMNKKTSLKNEKEWLKCIISDYKKRKSVQLFAFNEKNIVGSTGINLKSFKQSHIGSYGITISKGERGKGLGKKLTELILKLAKERLKGLELVILEVFKRNKKAISMYKKFGFKTVATLKGTIKNKGKYFDEYIMHLWVK
ncbi:Mycothiol acetyltransferase [Candidatus Tiddalikarchaeum anstoanum]|nr:Mycothiol acetyltransferase [Candidatus Tiddalikarchaeum anstoanum]